MRTKHSSHICTTVQTGWHAIYADAQVKLREAQAHVRHIRKAMKVIRVKIAAKEEFPVELSTHK